MGESRWRQAEEHFHLALEKSPAERADFLAQLDQELRVEVGALIEAYEASEAAPRPAPAVAKQPVQQIGPYTVVSQIGEGGMGAVYLAERADSQFEQRAAIKLIRPGPGSAALLDRFYKERQILAGLEHPNIARLLDGGATADGQPYLVMEYVDGERFDKYCDDRRLELRARLQLFRKVCAAVNYAHQRLIIHRDLKPNNILVTREGEPKLLDFGVAKVVKASPVESDMTATMGLFFTPLYASPELLCGQTTTVSSDIYSLGVILYHTLTGRLPHDEHSLSPGELISAVITRDPQRPSHSAGQTLEHELSPEELAARRGATPERLRKLLRGDLDGIVLRALAKNPAERYSSVEQLSADIENYLTGRPVQAVEATALYSAKKFIQRHKLGVAAAAALLLSLVGGLAGTLWQARVARQQTAEANLRFNDARKLANYLLFDLYASVKNLPGSTKVQAEMADRTLTYLDRLAAAKSDDPSLQTELARGYLELGDILGNPFAPNLGQTKRALEIYRKGLALIEPVAAARPRDREARSTHALILRELGATLSFMGKPEEGLPLTRRAAQLFDRLAADYANDVNTLLAAGLTHQSAARNLSQKQGWIEASEQGSELEASIQQSKKHLTRVLELAPGEARAYRMMAGTIQIQASTAGVLDPRNSLPLYQEGLAVLDRTPEPARQALETRRIRVSLLQNYAWDLGRIKDYAKCQTMLREATQFLREISDSDPNNLAALYHVAIPLRTAGIFNAYAGNLPAAIASYRDALAIYDRLIPRDPTNRIYPMFRAEIGARSAALLVRTGNLEEAKRVGQPALAFLDSRADDPQAGVQALLDAARWHIEITVPPLQDYRRALQYALRAERISNGKNPDALATVARCQWEVGQRQEALATLRRSMIAVPGPAAGEQPSPMRAELERMLAEYSGKMKQ